MTTDSKKTKKAPSARKPKAVALGSMEAEVFDFNNKAVGKIEMPKSVFGVSWNPGLVKQVVLAQMANLRRPWAHAKGRGEVRGGGKKPWKQKGTGRSRHGSIRSPIWKGGGKSHGPTKERDYTQKVNKKMKRAALFSVLSRKFKDGEIKIVKAFDIEKPKTALMATALTALVGRPKTTKKYDALLVYGAETKNLSRATRNLPKAKVLDSNSLNVYDILNYKHLLIEEKAVETIANHYKI